MKMTEMRKAARARGEDIRQRMAKGESVREIAMSIGVSRARVYQLIALVDVEPPLPRPPLVVSVAQPKPPGQRPDWSYPDEITLALCREIRAEMPTTPEFVG